MHNWMTEATRAMKAIKARQETNTREATKARVAIKAKRGSRGMNPGHERQLNLNVMILRLKPDDCLVSTENTQYQEFLHEIVFIM